MWSYSRRKLRFETCVLVWFEITVIAQLHMRGVPGIIPYVYFCYTKPVFPRSGVHSEAYVLLSPSEKWDLVSLCWFSYLCYDVSLTLLNHVNVSRDCDGCVFEKSKNKIMQCSQILNYQHVHLLSNHTLSEWHCSLVLLSGATRRSCHHYQESSESESSPEGTDSVTHAVTVNKNADGVAGVSSTSLNLERFWHHFPPIFPLQKGKTTFLSCLTWTGRHVPIKQVLDTIAPILSVAYYTVWLSHHAMSSGKTVGLSSSIPFHAIKL